MIAWRLPWIRLLAITIFAILAIVPSALWAGALTPITLDAIQHDTIVVPSYANADQMRLIKEYPSEGSDPTPSTWTSRGLFSYVVGMKFQGLLLSSVASAWTTDGRIRMHNKFDYTGYRYAGRSYGVGSSAGLIDDHLSSNPRTVSYQYQEPGYNTAATCVYNASSEFVLMETYDTMLWSASGPVPDSPIQSPEYSVYIGRGSNVIVAIGVTGKIERPRYVAFAAGANYSILNNVQCEISFSPALFNVTTHLEGRNITVTPNTISTPDIDPTGVLVKTAMRQYELIANDQTNIYVSFVGDSFNNSINAYRASLNTTSPDLDDSKAALAAIEASMTAMMDDMLVAYASAQLMIGNHTRSVPAAVKVRVLRFGENIYIYSIFVVNTLILLVVAVEAVRNSAWRRMPRFDFLDLDDLITYTWRACQSSLNAGRVPITGRSRLRLSTQAETLQLLR
ncbi:MAG: hypothetical protein M1828_004797 [Chrysothrix sp. TS-e1954]|nr:MAG: hypothetical protein M1828_004797 [Chrysothrix sp. TS-e1954]